jgi:hypothetical protein
VVSRTQSAIRAPPAIRAPQEDPRARELERLSDDRAFRADVTSRIDRATEPSFAWGAIGRLVEEMLACA